MELVYRASRDGWTPADFHARCGDNSPNTVTLYRVSKAGQESCDSVVGGFSSVPWTSIPGGWSSSPGAFVFILKDGTMPSTASTPSQPGMLDLETCNSDEAVRRIIDCGPNFGGKTLYMKQQYGNENVPDTLCAGTQKYSIPQKTAFVRLYGRDVTEVETFWVRYHDAPPGSSQSPTPGLVHIPSHVGTVVYAEERGMATKTRERLGLPSLGRSRTRWWNCVQLIATFS